MTAQAAHIDALCLHLRVEAYYTPGMSWDEGYAQRHWLDPYRRGIFVAPVESDETYLAALHELGHIACGHLDPHAEGPPQGYVPAWVLKNEAEAWEWALNNAEQCEITPLLYHDVVLRSLSSYYIARSTYEDVPPQFDALYRATKWRASWCEEDDHDIRPGGADFGAPRIDAADDDYWNFNRQEDNDGESAELRTLR